MKALVRWSPRCQEIATPEMERTLPRSRLIHEPLPGWLQRVSSRSSTTLAGTLPSSPLAVTADTGSCEQFWPPLLSSSKPTAGPGVQASLLGTTKRSNGSLQVTYNKHPLYSYTLDKQAGQTKGEGVSAFGATWYGLSAKGAAIVKSAAPATTTTSRYP